MEASEEILLNSLANSGVPIPVGVSAVRDLTPPSLFSLCSNALRLIDGHHSAPSLPASLPEDSMPEKVKICTELAHAFNKLGYSPELSFHKVPLIPRHLHSFFPEQLEYIYFRKFCVQFNNSSSDCLILYPSEEDLYNLVRFLVGKLSGSCEARTAAFGDGDSRGCSAKENLGGKGGTVQNEDILNGLKDLTLKTQALQSSYMIPQHGFAERVAEANSSLHDVKFGAEDFESKKQDFSGSECSRGVQDGSQNQGEVLKKSVVEKQQLDEELQLLKAAVEMVFDGEHPIEFHIGQLRDRVEAKRHKLKELELERNAVEKPLQEKKRNLEQSLLSVYPEASEKLMKMKEIELETESILAEIRKREEQLSKLSSDLEKQPNLAPRRSYIERVNEITKNSRKQDSDIERILKDTRELQLESNTIQERLNRTYAVVDETTFREAKKDPVARQAYRLLTNIHGSFEQIAEKILTTDRTRRDAADYEAKLAVISARSLNMGKLQADLDAITKENELLEQRLHE